MDLRPITMTENSGVLFSKLPSPLRGEGLGEGATIAPEVTLPSIPSPRGRGSFLAFKAVFNFNTFFNVKVSPLKRVKKNRCLEVCPGTDDSFILQEIFLFNSTDYGQEVGKVQFCAPQGIGELQLGAVFVLQKATVPLKHPISLTQFPPGQSAPVEQPLPSLVPP
jgi:hypothetical protein